MKRWLAHKGITSFAAVLLLFAAAFALYPIFYNTNDDVYMALIAKGYFTGTPDEHLVFINTLLGYPLRFLYTAAPAVEWYSLMLLSFLAVSLFLALYVMQGHTPILPRLAVWAVGFYFILNLQFTHVAFALVATGLLILATRRQTSPLWKFGGGVFLVWLGFLVRPDAAVCGVFVAVPFLWRRELKLWISAAVLAVLVAGAFWVHYQSYASGGWKTFLEYNLVRGGVNDNPNLADLRNDAAALKSLGITAAELALFENGSPTQAFDMAKTKAIYDQIKLPSSPMRYVKTIAQTGLPLLLFVILAFLAFQNRGQYTKLKISLGLFALLLALICLNHFPKERVVLDLLFISFILAAVSARGYSGKMLQWTSGAMLVFFVFLSFSFGSRLDRKFEFVAPPVDNAVPLFANYRTSFGRVQPFDMPQPGDNRITAGSWLVNSPVQAEQFRKAGITTKFPFSPMDDAQVRSAFLFVADTTTASKAFVDGPVRDYLASRGLEARMRRQENAFLLYQISAHDTLQQTTPHR